MPTKPEGPFQYTGKELGQAHSHLHIAPAGVRLGWSRDRRRPRPLQMPEPEKQEVLAAIVAQMAEVSAPPGSEALSARAWVGRIVDNSAPHWSR